MEGLDACALSAASASIVLTASIDAIRVTADEAGALLLCECARKLRDSRKTDWLQFEDSTTTMIAWRHLLLGAATELPGLLNSSCTGREPTASGRAAQETVRALTALHDACDLRLLHGLLLVFTAKREDASTLELSDNLRTWTLALRDLTFDMSGGPKGAKRPLERPLDGGVRHRRLGPGNGLLSVARP